MTAIDGRAEGEEKEKRLQKQVQRQIEDGEEGEKKW